MLFYRILRRIKESYYVYFRDYMDVSKKRDAFLDIFENEDKREVKWPKGKVAAFNLQFDDFSTKHNRNSEYDYGGNPNSKISIQFKDLFVKYPYLKTTIFTIPNPKFIKNNMYNHKSYAEQKFEITNIKNSEWLKWIKSSEFQKNNEIAVHGLYHCQYEIKNAWPFLEFEFKNETQCLETLDKSKSLFKKAGLRINGFKPPSWGIGFNSNYALISALQKNQQKLKYFCLSSPVSGLNWERKKVSNFYPQNYEGLLNIPQNINMLWPWEKIKKVIDFAIKSNGIIVPQLHFIEEGNWMDDGIGENNFSKLYKILNYLEKEYRGKIWFAKAEEIADFWRKNDF